ncbi:Phosducin-like protein 1 [Candida viswanathii]|uniref:Phosducin-like protein 1 n=1 Tax=Candida viswanathii TaxID=5486 RepID=A0A367XSF7_9ASCO|nr:Phosducin-like protein 1 [Candida viswanathii]
MNQQDIKTLEKYQSSKTAATQDSEDEDELFAELENEIDEDLSKYRESRIQQLSEEFKSINRLDSVGSIQDFTSEKDLMDQVVQQSVCLVHFYRPNFQNCIKMNQVLNLLAQNFPLLPIFTIDVENCPFLVAKLGLQVLPCLISYKSGSEYDRLIGFPKAGNSYDSLETYLYGLNVIQRKSINRTTISTNPEAKHGDEDYESDLDI